MTMAIAATDRVPAANRLGTDISSASSVDEALALAGLDWTVKEASADNLAIMDGDGVTTASFPGRRLFLRSDNNVILYAGGSRYTPVDNRDAFAAATAALNLGARFAFAGALDYGRITYFTLDLPDTRVEVGNSDLVSFELRLRTFHHGGKIEGELVGRRLACTNGMTVNLTTQHKWGIPHTSSAHDQLATADMLVKGAAQYAREFSAIADYLLDTPMNEREFLEFADSVFPEPDESEKRAHTIWSNRRDELTKLFRFADTNDLGRGSRWGAFNTITEWLDWGSPVRGGDDRRALRQFDDVQQDRRNYALKLLTA